jgi:hypothetical protein
VRPERRPRLAEAVAEARPTLVEAVDHLVHGARVDVESAREVGVERRQRRGQVDVGHQLIR